MALANRLFISTRPKGKSDELRSLIEAKGAHLIDLPTIEIKPVALSPQEKKLLTRPYNWIIFTSANAITSFFNAVGTDKSSVPHLKETKMAVIGEQSALKLKALGYEPTLVNGGNTAIDFSKELKPIFAVNPPNVLLPVGNLSGTAFEDNLSDVATFTRITLYKTVAPTTADNKIVNQVINDQYDALIFTSPSGFNNFCSLINNSAVIANIRAVCIGPTTAQTVENYGITPIAIGEQMSAKGIVETLENYYQSTR